MPLIAKNEDDLNLFNISRLDAAGLEDVTLVLNDWGGGVALSGHHDDADRVASAAQFEEHVHPRHFRQVHVEQQQIRRQVLDQRQSFGPNWPRCQRPRSLRPR